MGLDMYLHKKTYVKNWDHMALEERHEITVLKDGKPASHIDPKRICYIIEEVGYWRKANAIHKWFVDNVQNGVDECQESYLELDKLIELKGLCEQVLANHELAPKLLPSQSGFFFDTTDYDDWYFKDLENTVEIVNALQQEIEPKKGYLQGDLYYRSSW